MFNSINFINYYDLLNVLISVMMYLVLIIGLWTLFSDSILALLKKQLNKTRFRANLRKYEEQNKKSKLYNHLEMIFEIVYNTKNQFYIYTFILGTILIFILNVIIFSRQSSVTFTILFSTLFSLLPYGYIRLKLSNIRIEGSYEAEALLSEIINQYKINYFNMIEAIDKSISFLDKSPYTQKLLFRLSLGLKEYRTEQDLEELLKRFAYGIDTEWIKMLSNNIYLSIEDGMNVTASLEDILKEIRQAKSSLEESKRLNTEGFAIAKFLSPLFYIISIYISVKYFNFSISKFFKYQIYTQLGFKFFVVILLLMVFNYVMIFMYKRRKFDF